MFIVETRSHGPRTRMILNVLSRIWYPFSVAEGEDHRSIFPCAPSSTHMEGVSPVLGVDGLCSPFDWSEI